MAIKGKRILITGRVGFIGTAVSRGLAGRNQVVLYDSLWRNAIQTSGLLDHPKVRLLVGVVLEREQLAKSVEGAQIVLHMAAIAGIGTVVRSPIWTM